MEARYIMAIDQGTTGTRAIIVNKEGVIVSSAYTEFTQYYPQPGWVEHDPEEIWRSTLKVIFDSMGKIRLKPQDISAIGLTNQRETTVLWDRKTNKPVYNAIVWQCRRSAEICNELKRGGYEDLIREKTGLVIDAYFSASKIRWLLDNIPDLQKRAEDGEVLFGTIDSWLLWKLTNGKVHATDATNASRTMLFNIHTKQWDKEILSIFNIPEVMLPEVKSSSELYGYTNNPNLWKGEVPISGIVGDQQGSLFGQGCVEEGTIKNTYGTGCFMMMNTGNKAIISKNGLLTTLAADSEGNPCYAIEGSVFIAGAAIQWLRDGLGLINSAEETEEIAMKLSDTGGVYVVPAFVGLGAPYWDMYAKGAILGITRGTTKEHIIRATLEAIAYQNKDLLETIIKDCNIKPEELRVDGGASKNNFLMQFQADILNIPVNRPTIIETTALGAAFLAGLAIKYWENFEEIKELRVVDRIFEPSMDEESINKLYNGWLEAVNRIKTK